MEMMILVNVVISYNKLWKTMIDKNMNKTQLKETAKVSTNAIAKMGRNETVSMDTLCKVCYALDCGINDVIEITIRKEIGDERKNKQ